MFLTTKNGSRGKGDKIIIIKTRNGDFEPFSLQLLLQLVQMFFENEDRVYPRSKGHKGRWMLYEAISEVANGSNYVDVTRKYTSPKKRTSVFMRPKERNQTSL